MADEKEEEAKEEAAPDSGGGKKKKKLMLFAGIGLLATIGIGAGSFLMLSGGESTKEMSAETTVSPENATEEQKKEEVAEEKEKESDDSKPSEKGEGEEKKATEDKASTDEEAKEDQIDFGESFKLNTFHMNLGNPLENRYIRVEVSIEYKGGEIQQKELEKRKPQIRDVVVSVVSRKTREFLLAPDGKNQLRKELLSRINRFMSRPVESVFITDILIE